MKNQKKLKKDTSLFQFLIGSVKSLFAFCVIIIKSWFQFLIGSVKRELTEVIEGFFFVFQFLIGSVKSEHEGFKKAYEF